AKPVRRYSGRPTSPARPSTVNRATPPTTGGSTNGIVISARSSDAPRKLGRASTQASGTPMSSTMIIEMVAVITDSFSACSAPGLVSTAAASIHGARTSRPTSGKIKNSSARPAGAASSKGMPLCQGRSLTGLSGAPLSGGRLVAGFVPARVGCASGLGKASLGQHCLAIRGEDVVHEGLCQRWVLGVLHSGDRIGVDRVLRLRELHPIDLVAGGYDVGFVDHRGVDFVRCDLLQSGLHVLLQGVWFGGDLRCCKDLDCRSATRHLRSAQSNPFALVAEVLQSCDLVRISIRYGDLKSVGSKVLWRTGGTGCSDCL